MPSAATTPRFAALISTLYTTPSPRLAQLETRLLSPRCHRNVGGQNLQTITPAPEGWWDLYGLCAGGATKWTQERQYPTLGVVLVDLDRHHLRQSSDAVFEIRETQPKKLMLYLNIIEMVSRDSELLAATGRPKLAVVFSGKAALGVGS